MDAVYCDTDSISNQNQQQRRVLLLKGEEKNNKKYKKRIKLKETNKRNNFNHN